MIFAVIDTNVFVSALLTKHRDSATAKLVTGNLKHYPTSPIVVTPSQMVALLDASNP